LWGAIVFSKEHPVKSIPLSVLGLILLVAGIGGLSLSNSKFVKNCSRSRKPNPAINNSSNDSSPLLHADDNSIEGEKETQTLKSKLIGVACAIVLG
jgi:hypothetical protein